jgi:Cdc6-like AAA superfamily ATPase
MINRPTVVIVDEVDQLVPRGSRSSGSSGDLDDIVSLTQQPGMPPVAIILIANAVDLLTRANLGLGRCASLLFEPYNKDQLRQIAMATLDKLDNIATLDRGSLEVRVRQVAKQSGDCRQVVALCEEAKFKSATATGPIKLSTKSKDPLDTVSRLPMDQQLLLCVLAGSESEAVKITDVCSRYKQMCRKLHQPINLGTSGNVNSALCQLEQHGLLSMRKVRGAQVAELAVTRDRVRETMPPLFQRFF